MDDRGEVMVLPEEWVSQGLREEAVRDESKMRLLALPQSAYQLVRPLMDYNI